ncbi:AAA family ATPase [Vibrio splendidus]|uniref:AAA family ATPase n=1 Tax=Vibrio splendidus TaxID=29497 RepID=UPI000C838DF7|nr:DUF3696 domain-containing protein [Vibrio splendidus]PMM16825.1 hypothetical protein BCT62_05250 [Vibrio splendidus]PMN26591.1 hypothetical protein BCT36_01270 [Vibrio splendidus]
MIKNVHIKGFKSYRDKSIPLANLTLLSGLNNSGKSSVIQSLRMFAAQHAGKSPLLTGHGDLDDIRSDFVGPNEDITVSLTFNDSKISSMILKSVESLSVTPALCPIFSYIGADRLGPQINLPINFSNKSHPTVGEKGEYTFDYIEQLTTSMHAVPEKLSHPTSKSKMFEYELRGWITEIAPGVEFKCSSNKKSSVSHAEIDTYKPTNVGFGLSYTLPIIAATLGASSEPTTVENSPQSSSREDILLAIENPEAHLHPQGQTAMGRMLALAAACGIQIIVETHSEHVMDGVRIAVKEGLLNHSDVIFHYFEKDASGLTEVKTPNLDENGKLDFWPTGFFDQTLKNRSVLAKRSR